MAKAGPHRFSLPRVESTHSSPIGDTLAHSRVMQASSRVPAPLLGPHRQQPRHWTLASAPAASGAMHPAALVSLGVDDATTGGVLVAQTALADAFCEAVLSGQLACDSATLGASREEQAAAGRDILLSCGVRTRGSQRPAESYFVHTAGLPALADEALLDRLHVAASRALHSWMQRGGSGASGVTHLVVGSLTPPRSAPGMCSWVLLCVFPVLRQSL
jgi:hypothetical protein